MKKKDERFFSWLNNAVFYKNLAIMKRSYDDKRATLCNSHKKAKKIY